MRRILMRGIIIFCGVACVCGQLFSFPWNDIPVYPGSQKIKDFDLVVNNEPINSTLYRSSDSNVDIINFYREALVKGGWTPVYSDNAQYPHALTLQKKGHYLVISVQDSQFSTQIEERIILVSLSTQNFDASSCLVKGASKGAPRESAVPTTDTPGEDIATVPRYPETVRVNTVKMSRGTTVTYFSRDGLDEIATYYRDIMPSQNWSLVKEFDLSNLPQEVEESLGGLRDNVNVSGRSLIFKNRSSLCFIALTKSPEEVVDAAGTLIAIKYEK